MANSLSRKIYLDLSGGLRTEKHPLVEGPTDNNTQGTTTDESNFDCNKNRTRQRRLGADKYSSTTYTIASATTLKHFFKWNNAGKTGEDFVVVQNGGNINIYSSTTVVKSISLSSYLVSTYHTDPAAYTCDFASIKGYLIIVGTHIDPLYVAYDGTTFTDITFTSYLSLNSTFNIGVYK